MLTRSIPVLNNLSLKPAYRHADILYRNINTKSQSAGALNCEYAKQGESEEKKTKTECRESIRNRYVSINAI
jgi:hypothetical protein